MWAINAPKTPYYYVNCVVTVFYTSQGVHLILLCTTIECMHTSGTYTYDATVYERGDVHWNENRLATFDMLARLNDGLHEDVF